MKKNSIIISAFALLLILAGIVIYQEYQSKIVLQESKNIQWPQKTSGSSPEASTALPSESLGIIHPSFAELDAVAIDKAGWQTFKDKQYSFEISAPKNWSITLSADNGSLENGGQLLIEDPVDNDPFRAPVAVSAQIDNSSINDWLQKSQARVENSHEDFIKINIPTSDGAFAETVSLGAYAYSVKKGNKIFRFEAMDVGNPKNQDAMMKAIVYSLKFTK
ncbi:MAG: hypothetical protein PHO56_00110 [Patescibacteria group bacterium]|nr:hypothetical protein [Patescibacteria group bacterium]